jgi:hypothetical protein
MATNIHFREIEEDFELAENIKPVKVNLTTVKSEDTHSHKGLFKFSLSITYFILLVFFLFKLLT